MADETHVDPGLLETLAARLHGAGEDLDAAGATAPAVADAGEETEVLAAIVAHLSETAGNVVVGLKETAVRVDQARRDYQTQDTAAAADLASPF